MRVKVLAAVLVSGIAAGGPAVALSGCGSSSTSAGASSSSSTSSNGPAKLTITPPSGKRATSFTFAFTAPDASGRRGQSNLGYQLGVQGPAQAGCLAAHAAPAPRATGGERVSVTLDPGKLGGLWCLGDYSARITELQTPVCQPSEMCPQFIRVVRIVASGGFRVSAP
jgi:hypothetical protein